MRLGIHEQAEKHLLSLCEILDKTPSQVVSFLAKTYNLHLTKGYPLEVQKGDNDGTEEKRSV